MKLQTYGRKCGVTLKKQGGYMKYSLTWTEYHRIQPNPGLVHLLTGHGPYPQYLNRFNLKDNSLCECGEEGTPEHVVLNCLRYEDQENLRGRIKGRNLREIIEHQDTYNVLDKLAQKVSPHQQEIFNECNKCTTYQGGTSSGQGLK
ncbi:hypothetical protein JTB14_008501 [Gonioctena quinquepunctata]|nr:hypothetical protein JTB14_008501 [Gonioctena quinquepunctata]